MEVIDSVLFSQLIMNFETRWEKTFKQLELFRFPVERGHRCRKWLWQFGNSINIVRKICRIVVICQFLKRQKNLVYFDRRRGVFTAELRLTGGGVLFLLPWGYTWGAVRDFFVSSCHQVTLAQTLSLHSSHHVMAAKTLSLNSCHHVTAIFWPDFRIFWLPKMPASGWGSLWESSSFVPWFVLNAFWDISGVVPERPWTTGFKRKSSFTWAKWVGNVSLYRNYPQKIRNIRMYSVLYPESNFWWVFRNGSGMVPETFHNSFLGCSSKFFFIFCCQLSLVSGCHFLGKILISC